MSWTGPAQRAPRIVNARVRRRVAWCLMSLSAAVASAQQPAADPGAEVESNVVDSIPPASADVAADEAKTDLPSQSDAAERATTQDEESVNASLLDRAYVALRDGLRARVAPTLRTAHEPIDRWLGTLSLNTALFWALGLYGIAVAWVWTLRRDFVFLGAPNTSWWLDLRIWATVVVIPYVVVYWTFGK